MSDVAREHERSQIIAVEFGNTAYALKKIKKSCDQYYLVSNNEDYQDMMIDPHRPQTPRQLLKTD